MLEDRDFSCRLDKNLFIRPKKLNWKRLARVGSSSKEVCTAKLGKRKIDDDTSCIIEVLLLNYLS